MIVSFLDFSHTYESAGGEKNLALKKVSIKNITSSEIVGIVGDNGAGKSTFIERAAGYLMGNGSGYISVERNGRTFEVSPGDQSQLRHIFIPQKPQQGFVPTLSVIENLVLRRNIYTKGYLQRGQQENDERELKEFLSKLGLFYLIDRLRLSPETFSGGEQQLLNMASALFANPEVLLLDEPTSKLDEANRIRVWQLITEAAKNRNCIIICATHDREMAYRISDRIVPLENGEALREQGLRNLREERFVGEIRRIKTVSGLSLDKRVRKDWWDSKKDSIFGMSYLIGDNSREGYLAAHKLDRSSRTVREVHATISLLGLKAEHTVLDVPCGWGRHSLELASYVRAVIGIDLNLDYIKTPTKSKNVYKAKNIYFLDADMRRIPLKENSIDAIINLWNSFGYFDDYENWEVLNEWKRVLRPNGKILVHSDLNPRRVRKGIFDEPCHRHLIGNGELEVIETYCEADERIYGSWTVISKDGMQDNKLYRIAVYDESQWESHAKDIGLKIVAFLGSMDSSAPPLGDRSQEFVVILSKA